MTTPLPVDEVAHAIDATAVLHLVAPRTAADRVLPGVRWPPAARRPDGGWPAAPVDEYVRHVSRCRVPSLTQGPAPQAPARYRRESTR